ncbi:P-loop containing nucleoside triphosphate hydrolase protein [Mycena amicta]|nr:P-loop containing nucleoside triphosphate hydrolase protein [Mycena amicta]
MPPNLSWSTPEGLTTLKSVVRSRIPAWSNGLRPQQEEPILRILDGSDVLLCTATGAGKSALFIVPIFCHLELSAHPEKHPRYRVRQHPVGVIITPTKGLARNIVDGLRKYGISAVAYDRETLAERRSLARDIAQCTEFHVVCVDPEHLMTPEWDKIVKNTTFAANLIYVCVEEAHLVREWLIFRAAYGNIGPFVRGKLSRQTSIVGLSATIQPGVPEQEVCTALGFNRTTDFHLFRHSNERPEIRFVLEPLAHGMKSRSFPQLIPYLNSGRKCIVYTQSLDTLTRVYTYLCKMSPKNLNPGRRIRVYSALCDPEFNAETLRLMCEPELQVIVSSVALANGVDCASILDIFSIGFPSTLSQAEQEAGRAVRVPGSQGQVTFFVQKSDIATAKKYIASLASDASPAASNSRSKRKKNVAESMDLGKAKLLTETVCLVASRNRTWNNPPIEKTTMDCITAKRPLPCSLCSARAKIVVELPSHAMPTKFLEPPPPLARAPVPRSQMLRKVDRPDVKIALELFADTLFKAERFRYPHRPESWFFPPSIRALLVDNCLRLETRDDLVRLLASKKWPFCVLPEPKPSRQNPSWTDLLWEEMNDLGNEILVERVLTTSTGRKRKAKEMVSEEDTSSDDSAMEEASATSQSRRRIATTLTNITNTNPQRPRARQAVQSIEKDIRPAVDGLRRSRRFMPVNTV